MKKSVSKKKAVKTVAKKKKGTPVNGSRWTSEEIEKQNSNVVDLIASGESIVNACKISGLKWQTFYVRLKKDPKLYKKIEHKKECIKIIAENTIYKIIQIENERASNGTSTNVDITQWWLEKRCPEYSSKGKVEVGADTTLADMINSLTKSKKSGSNKSS